MQKLELKKKDEKISFEEAYERIYRQECIDVSIVEYFSSSKSYRPSFHFIFLFDLFQSQISNVSLFFFYKLFIWINSFWLDFVNEWYKTMLGATIFVVENTNLLNFSFQDITISLDTKYKFRCHRMHSIKPKPKSVFFIPFSIRMRQYYVMLNVLCCCRF